MTQNRLRHFGTEEGLDESGADDGVLGETAKLVRREIRPAIQPVVVEKTHPDIVDQASEANGLDLLR